MINDMWKAVWTCLDLYTLTITTTESCYGVRNGKQIHLTFLQLCVQIYDHNILTPSKFFSICWLVGKYFKCDIYYIQTTKTMFRNCIHVTKCHAIITMYNLIVTHTKFTYFRNHIWFFAIATSASSVSVRLSAFVVVRFTDHMCSITVRNNKDRVYSKGEYKGLKST